VQKVYFHCAAQLLLTVKPDMQGQFRGYLGLGLGSSASRLGLVSRSQQVPWSGFGSHDKRPIVRLLSIPSKIDIKRPE